MRALAGFLLLGVAHSLRSTARHAAVVREEREARARAAALASPSQPSVARAPPAALRAHHALRFDPHEWRELRSSVAAQLRCTPDALGTCYPSSTHDASYAGNRTIAVNDTKIGAHALCHAVIPGALHELDLDRFPRASRRPGSNGGDAARIRNRARTTGPNRNEAALAALQAAYERFVCAVVAPHVAAALAETEASSSSAPSWAGGGSDVDRRAPVGGLDELDELVFQTTPALRVSPPAERPAGRRHRDADYGKRRPTRTRSHGKQRALTRTAVWLAGHQPSQINFWMPLSAAFGSNTLHVEDEGDGACRATSADGDGGARAAADGADAEAEPTRGISHLALEGEFGTLHRFDGNRRHHFTLPNDTGATRVSLDFRVVPGPLFDDDWPRSRNPKTGRQSFFVGGYYARARRYSSGEWRVVTDG